MLRGFRKYIVGAEGVFFAATGIVGALLVSWYWYLSISNAQGPLPNVIMSFGGILLSFGFGGICNEEIKILREGRGSRRFREFFGVSAFSGKGYPTVFLRAEPPSWPEGCGRTSETNLKLSNSPSGAGTTLPKGITHIVPSEDLEAVLEIDGLFRKFGGKLDIQTDTYGDKKKSLPEQGCLAIGLGYNNITVRLQEEVNDLYQVRYDEHSDDFAVGRGTDTVKVPQDCDGYALIARVLVRNPAAASIPYIVCAGQSAPATCVACRYLANCWPVLADAYEKDDRKLRLDQFSMVAVLWYRGDKQHLEPPHFELIKKQ